MSGIELKKLNKLKIALILLFIILLIASILDLLPFNQNCQQLCFFGTFSNSYINGTLYLNKSILRNTAITMVLNNKQSAIYNINENGKVNLYIPFSLGYNNLDLYYGSYKDSINIFYLGDFSSFIILIGAVLFYFIIKQYSDFRSESSSVRIRYNKTLSDYAAYKNNNITFDMNFDGFLKSAFKKANTKQIIKDIALPLDALVEEKISYSYNPSYNIDQIHENLIYELDSRYKNNYEVYNFSDMVAIGKNPLKSIITKKLYDYSLNNGRFKIKKDKFLESNNILLLSELDEGKITKAIRDPHGATIVLLSKLEENRFLDILSKANQTSSLLLLSILLKKVDVLAL